MCKNNNLKAVVTGCAGFVGSHLVERLLSIGYFVIGVDNFRTGKYPFMDSFISNPNFKLIDFDLNLLDADSTLLKGVDIVYHMAANADVRGGMSDTTVDLQFNLIMTHRILECMKFNGVKRLCFASTAAALGEPNVFPTPEEISTPVQTSIYGASKMSCEHFISSFANCFGIEAYVFRFVSLLGPRYPHGHVIDFVRKLCHDPTVLHILGDGTAQKSYLHINDCIDALELVCERLRPAKKLNIPYEVYHLGFDGYIRVKDSAQLISHFMDVKPIFQFETQQRGWIGDNPFVHLSTDKIKKLGWTPQYTIEQSIEDTVLWLLAEQWMLK